MVSIELRALAGLTYPLVHPSYKPDAAAGAIFDLEDPNTSTPADLALPPVEMTYQSVFPYLSQPHSGFTVPRPTP